MGKTYRNHLTVDGKPVRIKGKQKKIRRQKLRQDNREAKRLETLEKYS